MQLSHRPAVLLRTDSPHAMQLRTGGTAAAASSATLTRASSIAFSDPKFLLTFHLLSLHVSVIVCRTLMLLRTHLNSFEHI